MAKFSVAAQLFTVRDYCKNDADIAVTLKKISDIGYREVQVSGVTPARIATPSAPPSPERRVNTSV